MSIEALKWAIEVRGVSSLDKLILLLLANRHNQDSGRCYPSLMRLVEESGADRKTVIKAIDRLAALGLIDIEKTYGRANQYTLKTSTKIGTSPKNGTSPKIGTGPVPKLVLPPVPKLVPEPEDNPKEPKGRFRPPSLDEVAAYCKERGNSVNPDHFLDHYEANGWMRGKTKIKCWKACVRTWEKNNKSGERPKYL